MKTTQALIIATAFVPLGALGVVALHFGLGARDATRYRERLAALEARGALSREAELSSSDALEPEAVHPGLARLLSALDQGDAALLAALEEQTSGPIERVRSQAARGEQERAARSIVQGLALAELAADGTLSGARLGMLVRRHLLEETALLVEAGVLDPRVLLELLGPELEAGFDAAEIERLLRLDLSGLRALGPEGPSLDRGARGLLDYPRQAESLLAGLEALERCPELVSLTAEEFEAESRALIAGLSGDDPLRVANTVAFVASAREEHAFEILFHVALAAHAFQVADGEWPATLDLLASFLDGRVPDDPWTGAPFVYESHEEGRVLGLGATPEAARRRRFPTAGALADPKGTPAFLLK